MEIASEQKSQNMFLRYYFYVVSATQNSFIRSVVLDNKIIDTFLTPKPFVIQENQEIGQ